MPIRVEVHEYDDGEWKGCLPAAAKLDLLDQHIWTAYVAGIRHHPDSALAVIGSRIRLVPDTENPFDTHATAVWTDDGLRVGWLPRHLAAEVDSAIARQGLLIAELRVDGQRAGLWMLVSRQPVELFLTPEPSPGRMHYQVDHMKKAALESLRADEEDANRVPPLDPLDAMRQMLDAIPKESD